MFLLAEGGRISPICRQRRHPKSERLKGKQTDQRSIDPLGECRGKIATRVCQKLVAGKARRCQDFLYWSGRKEVRIDICLSQKPIINLQALSLICLSFIGTFVMAFVATTAPRFSLCFALPPRHSAFRSSADVSTRYFPLNLSLNCFNHGGATAIQRSSPKAPLVV
jgi:hypothetical protein